MKLKKGWGICLLILLTAGCSTDPQPQHNTQLAEIDTELALLDLNQHQPEQARMHLLDANQLAMHDPMVLAGEGFYDLAIHENAAAAVLYQEAIARAPQQADIQDDYGVFLYRMQQFAQALPYFLKAASNPENLYAAEAFQNAAMTELKLGNQAAAAQYFKAAHWQE